MIKKINKYDAMPAIPVMRRTSYLIAAFGFLTAIIFPIVQPRLAQAAQLADRSITLSDSGSSGGTIVTGIGSGTNVTYQVQFTTSAAADSIVLEFCANNPIIRDSCTAPTGMDVSTVGLAGTGSIEGTGWSVVGTNTPNPLVKIARTTGVTAAAGVHVFQLTGITNPVAPASATPEPSRSFYSRIYTYADTAFNTANPYTSATNPGGFVDYGGIALTTNQIITITARVQEQLTFCVSGAPHSLWVTTNDCGDAQAVVPPALTLGHGSPTSILDNTAIDKAAAYSQISTNAIDGFAVAVRNSNAGLPTPCGGLSANATDCGIPAINGGGFAIGAMTIGNAAFGMAASDGMAGVDGTGAAGVLADANYKATTVDAAGVSTANDYGMDTSATTAGGDDTGSVIGTFGDTVVTAPSPVYRVNNTFTFAATASLVTPAGIYTASMDLIATGKF